MENIIYKTINLLFTSMSISYICYIWLNTNAFYDYFSLSKIFKKIPLIKEYENQEFNMDFSMFLAQKNNFLAKLFSCHICLTFWLSVLCYFIFGFNPLCLAFLSLYLYNKLL